MGASGRPVQSSKSLRRRNLALLAVLVLAGISTAIAVKHWPKAPLDPKEPSTWPVTERRAVVLARGLDESCPPSSLGERLAGTEWRDAGTWQQPGGTGGDFVILSKAGILCLRAVRDLGSLHKIGRGAEQAPNSALFVMVIEKDETCPPGANYETDKYCLKATKLPPAPDIAP